MKKAPILIIGLGNPLMGDDGIGCVVAERLAAGSGLPDGVEVLCGGTDLLAWAAQMEGRSRVIIVDAMEGSPGAITVWKDRFEQLDDRQEHAHHLSVVQSLHLMQRSVAARFTLVGIGIVSARAGDGVSDRLAARVPAITARVMQELNC